MCRHLLRVIIDFALFPGGGGLVGGLVMSIINL